jgi:hypothetical protein
MADLVSGNLKEEKNAHSIRFGAFRWPLCIDPQLVVSIRQKTNQPKRSLGFHRVLLAESKHKRQLYEDGMTVTTDARRAAPS